MRVGGDVGRQHLTAEEQRRDAGTVARVDRRIHLHEPLRRMEMNASIDTRHGTGVAALFFGRQVLTPDIATDPHWTEWRELPSVEGLMAVYAMPVKGGSGAVLGAL